MGDHLLFESDKKAQVSSFVLFIFLLITGPQESGQQRIDHTCTDFSIDTFYKLVESGRGIDPVEEIFVRFNFFAEIDELVTVQIEESFAFEITGVDFVIYP